MTLEATTAKDGTTTNELLKQTLTSPELEPLREISDLRGVTALAANWGLTAAWLALVAIWPNPLTILLALFGIGARQLGCAVLMHEAAHRALFRNRKLNDWAGNWLAAYPVWSDVAPYRRYHLIHHAHTGTPKDPDLALTAPFPLSPQSLWRKVWRDLSGQTGIKQVRQTVQRDLDLGNRRTQRNQGLKVGERPDVGWHKIAPFALWNLVIFSACWLAGHPAVYLLWPIAFLTTYRLVLRIRSIAEHALSGPPEDPLRNTRTTLPSWWERIFIAPLGINWHLEHHLVTTVPWYNLPKLHALLQERGLMANALVTRGYVQVLRDSTTQAVS